jgi:hypothetical protein
MIILFYNKTDSEYWYFKCEDFPPGYYFTTDTQLFDIADVVVFYLPTLVTDRNLIKRTGQVWVGWSTECQAYYPQYEDKNISSLFDLRMGYRRSDDIFTPYIYPRYRKFLKEINPSINSKSENLAMFISSPCNLSARFEYANSLKNHINIDSYGRMMNNKKIDRDCGIISKRDAIMNYRFTIAFENSIANDYVTEKFYEPLLMGSVPIYMGAPNIDDFAPGTHSYINVNEFTTPKQLAEYLTHLINTPDEYKAYFDWKREPYKQSFEKLLVSVSEPVVTRLINAVRGV